MVKVMGEATVSADAIRTFHDQSWVIRCQKCRPQRTGTLTSTEAGGRGLTGSRTKGSFAKDWNDRLLSEYRFGCSSEAGFEFGTSAVTPMNLG